MKSRGALLAALLLLSTVAIQVFAAEDLYLEGEDEFLEVKDETIVSNHLRRLKRGFFDIFDWTSSTTTTENYGSVTEDQLPVDEEPPDERDEELDNDGSGLPAREVESREKTLRVTFVVNQPYQTEYSNRDSTQFQNFSRSLADAVNSIFDSLPGTQRASLVRIQSRTLDVFTCKVTLDIVTTDYDDTQRIADMLKDHIRNTRKLGSIVVSDTGFSATVINPGNPTLDACLDEFRCEDGRCVSLQSRCNGYADCLDSSDEIGCPRGDEEPEHISTTTERLEESSERSLNPTLPPPEPTSWLPWGSSGSYENQTIEQTNDNNIWNNNEPTVEQTNNNNIWNNNKQQTCPDDELKCDDTRCVPLIRRCDGVHDCYDGTDEANCESCGTDDFRCDNGKCISRSRRCDGIDDCPTEEDEQNCYCSADEFRCISDGSCIEKRKVCDGVSHCADSSDEVDCACGKTHWQCDHGSCIKRNKLCDGRVDCPTDRSDERNCLARGFFRCSSGKIIPESLRCNRRYDCTPGDFSDEHNCPCGADDFRCDNGFCIPASKHCDRTHDCQDGSDERHCTYGTECMAYQYKCSNGECVQADSLCNGTVECQDGSDEIDCPCKRDEFECRDGSCISLALRCDDLKNCPLGEDEFNCGEPQCPPGSFTCQSGSSVACAKQCDGLVECDNGEDEDQCQNSECAHECDGQCLDDSQVCDGISDCSDNSDEQQCEQCDGPDDFRCGSGECLNKVQRCNSVPECSDYSDEQDCRETIFPSPQGCTESQFQCRDGTCINSAFFCDGNNDCADLSDEQNCPWHEPRPSRSPDPPPASAPCHESEFTCYNGRCIPHLHRCDNIYDCSDFSDEQNCYYSACDSDKWQCVSGQCIPNTAFCDGIADCTDGTDEASCPTTKQWTTTAFPFIPVETTPRPVYTTTSFPYLPDRYPSDRCDSNQWRCENGPCIYTRQRCDGHVDCPHDGSDEFDCPAGTPVALNLKTYPEEQTIRSGADVVFQCRDEGPHRVPVRWFRENGRRLKPGSIDRHGRLELYGVSVSDAGTYICRAIMNSNSGAELRVQLTVTPPVAVTAPPRPRFSCPADKATCNNGQCISKSSLCDGKRDCSDGSDENECGNCQPSEFRCANNQCILMFWKCDLEMDCEDGSDEGEALCGRKHPSELCSPAEFMCHTRDKCVPRSYHCDGRSECPDHSDELGCAPVHVTKMPTPSNVRLNSGETLTLKCEAVGVPTPLISWRLNWGHVPKKCTSTSNHGMGTLECHGMETQDSGAYSCEAINNKGTTFAALDAIVFVNNTDVCPSGYFNSEARSETECIRCFCFGESTQCRSADLFTYNMPTPLGKGGTRLVGIKQTNSGDYQVDQQPITDQYYYQELPLNGASVTKLENYGSNWYGSRSSAHPYLTLPETYNGNQLTSYGGHIKYKLVPHSPRYGSNDGQPDVIIKGKFQSLVHYSRAEKSRETYIETRLTPENWQKVGPSGVRPATREDIMMALDNVELILLRADLNNAGVNITHFSMESAQHINVGLGAASLVEECTCPPGYEGLSCQKCAAGYVRVKSGSWLGNCMREQRQCPPGTYGDPDTGYGCRPCPCPLTNRENQFARTCSVGPSGGVICDCQEGYRGAHCEICEEGYVGNPLNPGDNCRRVPTSRCNAVGTVRSLPLEDCQCKDNVQGRYCDQCKDHSFYLSQDFRHGCALCFCTGVSQECSSSNLRRVTTTLRFNTPQVVNQVRVYSSAPSGSSASKYNAPVETEVKPQLIRGVINLGGIERTRPSIYYWSLPASFSGDKVTSYGGHLRYTLVNAPLYLGTKNVAADVQLISENRLTFHYFGDFQTLNDGTINATVQFLEKGWQRPDGKEISREHFLLALADVKAILIKATYASGQIASLDSASIETAAENGNGPQALHVEQCVCPSGYVGSSCEDCAPGFTRSSSGLYLEHCEPCNCNGHSTMCHPETGVCFNCRGNSDGDNCEVCKPGYNLDPYNNCVPSYDTTISPIECRCDPRGSNAPCDERSRCSCKQNVEGEYCDRCRAGTFGLDGDNLLGCTACYCSGATTDCHEASHYTRVPVPAPIFGDNYGGYSLTNLNADKVINDQFVPVPNESELMYMFSNDPREPLYWSLPVFPGNRVLSYGGTLNLTQKFEIDDYADLEPSTNDVILVGETISIYWTNPTPIRSGETLSTQVPLREDGWFILNSPNRASRTDFMSVLKNIRRVLVRATLAEHDLVSTAIADVSMDIATDSYVPGQPAAKGVEICMCPEGHSGTSCESCVSGWYKDLYGGCKRCSCNGHDCQLNSYNSVVCICRPPYTGPDCSSIGLIMELHPTVHKTGNSNSLYRSVTLTCKYRGPKPLTIKFYFEGNEVHYPKYYNESKQHGEGWYGEHEWSTVWDTRRRELVYECHTLSKTGFTVGLLSTSMPEPESAGSNSVEVTTLPPPAEVTVVVRIMSPTIKIQEVGTSVNFTCQAQSIMTQGRLPVTWTKVDSYLPQGRSYYDTNSGLLHITNLQHSDSGTYVCQTSDGITTAQARATLKVPGNDMTVPTVTLRPATNDYYEGDRIQLECVANGNPTPRISWQRGQNRPLPLSAQSVDNLLIIDSAREEDSGEYKCIALNTAGSTYRTTIVAVRPRPSWPTQRDRLTISPSTPFVNEGQSTRVVCTGTTNVPAGSIDWIRQDGSVLLSNVRSENGVLYIDVARPENQGVYICQSTGSDAPPVPVLVTIVPLSQYPPSGAPNVTVSVQNLKIPTGGSGTVDCNPSGYPLPLVKWKKYEGEFGPGTSQRDHTLIISNAQDEDKGYYLCEGSVNGSPVNSIYVYVDIEKRELPRVEIWPQGEQAVALGSLFELHCRVLGGIPEPVVTWDRAGGRPLSTYTQLQPHNILRFEKVDVNDEGTYTCTATNAVGKANGSAVIKVRSRPEITLTPGAYIEAQQGDPLNVECRANGYPEPMVSIRSMADNRQLVPPTVGIAALRISQASDRDDGDYVCLATSAAGESEERITVRIDRGDGGYGGLDVGSGDGDGEILRPRNMIAIEGADAIIGCEVSAPDLEVTWHRVDRPLQQNAVQRGKLLIITKVTKSDSGEYECIPFDRFNEPQGAGRTSLEVVAAPTIALRPKTQTVRPGQSTTVECVVDGDDVIDISWERVNKSLSNRVEASYSTLLFKQIEVEDAGWYRCVARSRYTEANATAQVIVSEDNGRGALESHDNEQFAHIGAAVHLSCNITKPNLMIEWSKNGRRIPSNKQKSDGSIYIKHAYKSDSGRYVCHIRDEYGRRTSNYINLHIEDTPEETPSLVSIEQTDRQYRVGENLEVLCRASVPGARVTWARYGNNQQLQFVETRPYRDGSILVVPGVEESDAGVYRCTGQDPYERTSYQDYNLEVIPVSIAPNQPNRAQRVYKARLGDTVDLPCEHNLEKPVTVEWGREHSPLPNHVRLNEPILHLERVSESDADVYVCRVTNSRTAVEARAILIVEGIVPLFDGHAWLSMPTIEDAFRQFDIEISFKPTDGDGLILYNSQNAGRSGDYVALHLVEGVPHFVLGAVETDSEPLTVHGDRPLQLNAWHTVRVSRTNAKVTMDVDNIGPFTAESSNQWDILELQQPLYIGGVPDYDQLPEQLAGTNGFVGCVSMLILGHVEKNIMEKSTEKHNVKDCDSCSPNQCLHDGVCQEARNERGHKCLCTAGFAGVNCDRTGDACRPGVCGPGKCSDTPGGYKCACPVTYTGKHCEVKQSIEYPAFTGSAYLAIKAPKTSRSFRMSMKIKAASPVADGIIMYCAENARGYGGFTSLAVRDGKIEFRYDLGDGAPAILTANKSLLANEWTDVHIDRLVGTVTLRINLVQTYVQKLRSPTSELNLDTPMFVGGVEDSIILNNNTGVSGGFNGCIKDVMVYGENVDIVNSSIQSANVQECVNFDRGDIPDEVEGLCSQCRNGGYCTSADATACTCPAEFTGTYCEVRLPQPPRRPSPQDPCAAQPCRNGGSCRHERSRARINYSCDCPLGFAGANCQMPLELLQSVGFNGNGYLELPAEKLRYERQATDTVTIALAFHTANDGLLLYQREIMSDPNYGDFIMLRVERGRLVLEWDFGSGPTSLRIDDIYVNDGERHAVFAILHTDNTVSVTLDGQYTKRAANNGLSTRMNADSNIYIGGVPDHFNIRYPGLVGCIEQLELMDVGRALKLGAEAVAGRNAQRCKESRS